MPTGYTADILDKPNFTFRDFVWLCVRNFGVAYSLRDDSLRPITTDDIERIRTNDTSLAYHRDELAKAHDEMVSARSMTHTQWAAQAATRNAEAIADYDRTIADHATKRARLEAMLDAAQSWNPPTSEHANLQTFMVEQLTSTIRFDCYDVDPPMALDVDTFRNKRLKDLQWKIDYHREHLAKAKAREQERAAWIDALAASVPPPA